jgi:inorganic pyrophosphatase
MACVLLPEGAIMPDQIGGYPVNYGFVPQTVSYDGDPFDALVLGPPIRGGRVVRGTIVGLMFMENDSAVALQDSFGASMGTTS